MAIFKNIWLVITYGRELEQLLTSMRQENERKEREARAHHLHLCLKHQQEQNRSHYAEHNCDYCKLLKEVNELRAKL